MICSIFVRIQSDIIINNKNMAVKVIFGASIILAGLFLALPETMAPIAGYGPDPYTISRLVGIVAVVFEAWWAIRKLQGK